MTWPFVGSLTIGAHTIETRAFGPSPAETPTLVFLHEGLGSVAAWRDVPERWASAVGLGAVVSSRAGYGASSPAALPRTPRYLHEEAETHLPALLRALGVTRPILVGHSDGGSIALVYAGKHLEPRPLALVLEAPHVFVEDVSIRAIAEAKVAFESGALGPRLQRYHALPVADVFRGWNDVWLSPGFRDWNIEDVLSGIDRPTLVLQGDADPYGTAEQVERIRRGVRGRFEARFLPGCGHAPHREKAEDAERLVRAFVASCVEP